MNGRACAGRREQSCEKDLSLGPVYLFVHNKSKRKKKKQCYQYTSASELASTDLIKLINPPEQS